MLVYDEEGSKACQVFVDRQGLRTDSRIKALVQATLQAIPTTRGKDGKFLRPEMTTLDALRLLFWEDLPGRERRSRRRLIRKGGCLERRYPQMTQMKTSKTTRRRSRGGVGEWGRPEEWEGRWERGLFRTRS